MARFNKKKRDDKYIAPFKLVTNSPRMRKRLTKPTQEDQMPRFYVVWQSELTYLHPEVHGALQVKEWLRTKFNPKFAGTDDIMNAHNRALKMAEEYHEPYDTVILLDNQGTCLGRAYWDTNQKQVIWINDAHNFF